MTEIGAGDEQWGDKVAKTRGDVRRPSLPLAPTPTWGWEYQQRVKEGLIQPNKAEKKPAKKK